MRRNASEAVTGKIACVDGRKPFGSEANEEVAARGDQNQEHPHLDRQPVPPGGERVALRIEDVVHSEATRAVVGVCRAFASGAIAAQSAFIVSIV